MLLKTYAFHLGAEGRPDIFRPVMCANNADALAKAQELLERHPERHWIDVFLGEVELFRVLRD